MAPQEQAVTEGFRNTRGELVQLGRRLGGGGEGVIWEIDGDPVGVVKLFHHFSAGRAEKLQMMRKAAPLDPYRSSSGHFSFCWPEELVYDGSGACVGFIMPRVQPDVYRPLGLYWDACDRAALHSGITWRFLVVVATNVASLMALLHAEGHIFGDLNEENLLVSPRGQITVVDCDSFQIYDRARDVLFRSPVVREPYISPERIDVDLEQCTRTREDDYWALSMLLFQLLVEGQHPTDGAGQPEERRERIRAGLFPTLNGVQSARPKYALPIDFLPPDVLFLFKRCFVDGHSDPAARPSAAEWCHILSNLALEVFPCPVNPLHWYSSHRQTCVWCDHAERWGVDRFSTDLPASTSRTYHYLPGADRGSVPLQPAGNLKRWPFAGFRAVAALAAAAIVFGIVPAVIRSARTPVATVLPPIHVVSPQPTPVIPPNTLPSDTPAQSKPAFVPVPVYKRTRTTTPAIAPVPVVVDSLRTAPTPTQILVPTLVHGSDSGKIDTDTPLPNTEIPPAPRPLPTPAIVALPTLDDTQGAVQQFRRNLSLPKPSAPQHGTLVWSGRTAKNEQIVIGSNAGAGLGNLRGDRFPGVPIIVDAISPAGFAVTEPPSPSNGFQRLVLRSLSSRTQIITITWHTP